MVPRENMTNPPKAFLNPHATYLHIYKVILLFNAICSGKKTIKLIMTALAVLLLQGCSSYSYTNKRIRAKVTETKASFNVATDRGGHQRTLVILSLSGGGSRAAYWSASIMLALQEVYKDEGLDILSEVDIISSVSGGSLPAAYYAISRDREDNSGNVRSNRIWRPRTVKDLMTRNYKLRWVGNWFWPNNILKYWFTAFDRSDIMAQTLSDNMFDVRIKGSDLKFKDINQERPYLVINATNGTTGFFSKRFTFTHEDFNEINADISKYHIGRAVMASASFPAAFNYMTLRNYSKEDGKRNYIHVFDGGNHDNLGLSSVARIIEVNHTKYRRIVVILLDAYTESQGVNAEEYDARKLFDYAVDLNFIDSVDSLLANNRDNIINEFKTILKSYKDNEMFFYHIKFLDCQNLEELNSIRTDFKIEQVGINAIDTAVKNLIVKENVCLNTIKNILITGSPSNKYQDCNWRIPDENWKD